MLVDLNPVVFHLGPLALRWYGILMALSFVTGGWYLYSKALKMGFDEDFILNLIIIVTIAGIVGARLVFVLANYPEWFTENPIQIIKIYEGGVAWHGGLLGGMAAGWLYIRRKGVKFGLLADLAVPGLAIGYFTIRIANIFNQEILGRMTEFWFGNWPSQPIGSAIGLALLLRYIYVQRKNPPAGYQFWSFIFYHQLLRGLVEETVRDNPLILGGIIVPGWGLGFFTLVQLLTPLIMLIAYLMMRQTKLSK
ncbi:MAG: Prolipoprotein diacylglyceryl transferase [Desulfotomaculum sp. 46_296]|nr:MAG: Prolipoprotein diacylglyceryl transferase [Desulfotomaculum sp. 46_296]KUK84882.1 MAG: Prolipoprotein diacylglyceryl transferase [Desulfofundulus kuznetsovii]HAU31495.1 prolipoprotein diacylglyceryl transferase [Desulfotomaculum sp.]